MPFVWEYAYKGKLAFQFCSLPQARRTESKAKDVESTCKNETVKTSGSCYGTGKKITLP